MNPYEKCELCPRKCGVNRYDSTGFCGAGAFPICAKASLHKWEEPCISYRNGAGTVFFSGCNLHCVYCQNNAISNELFGMEITAERLAEIYLNLQESGADNIELVTPTHFLPDIVKSLDLAKNRLEIPVIYNSGGYELAESIKMLDGYIDVYLPDMKYFSADISQKYSSAPDYFERASEAVAEMIRQTGKLQYNDGGGLVKGTIIRHLVLPGCRHDSMKIMDWIAENTDPEQVLVSIMSQYTPFDFIPQSCSELRRKVTKMEYNSVVRYARNLGICGFVQEKSSSDEKYVPDFDLSGIK
ncbi:MAG: radical SAM protein [Ruminococcus flavefaciens]|nr:radical SAM protein [Ruminococcus flavefaciens]MCM1230615.1 radical SAM protein [Ruminococcus flavefaciens]